MQIGKRLKSLRKEKKMTLEELSKASGVAVATLSRMEHDKMTGTLGSHISICKALGVSLSSFYHEIESEHKMVSVIKQKETKETAVRPKKAVIEILATKIMEKKMMPVMIRMKKGGQTQREENKPGTEKFIYVLEGNMLVEIGKEKYELARGDSLYFDASLPHVFVNTGQNEAAAVCVLTPPEF